MEPGRRERREQRRWRREAVRRLEELDRVDREQGLGSIPSGTPGPGSGRHRRREKNGRRTTGPVLPGLLVSGILAGLVMLHDPGMTGYRFRQLTDHLTGKEGGSYAFVATNATGDPVGWDPCRPIRYVVNPAGAPEDWEEIVRTGVDTVSAASDFDFEYAGTSAERAFGQREIDTRTPPPVLIGWADATEVPQLDGATAGIGGSTPVRTASGVRFVTGMVVLDTDTYERMELTRDRRSEVLILAHELGHVLGLDHVDDRDELMYAQYRGQTGFGPGDLEGLKRLHDLPCG